MRETNFIRQNKEKWQEFDRILAGESHDPDKLNDLFIQITDDLSYSRTFYPNRSVRVYLNGLAQQVFFRIYRSRRSPLGRLFSFWIEELPRMVYQSRADFRLSFWIFVLAFLIGAVSSAMDPDFAAVMLGEDYQEMTEENIRSGDPMAVYKQRGAFSMSLSITFNNIFVAFLTFSMGAFFAVGTIAVLMRNAVMVGAFQFFFIERGLFWESFLTIWIHGVLEISAIIIAGAAGITMGKGLLFPGTYSRMQSFQQSARRGVKIMIGIVPIFILAGFIEGYLTRYTETPPLVRGLFILSCLAFVLLYFVWYPAVQASIEEHKPAPKRREELPADSRLAIDFEHIKTPGEAFADVFLFFKKHFGKMLSLAGILALVYVAGAFLLREGGSGALFSFPNRLFGAVSSIGQFFVNRDSPWLPLINFLVFSILTVGVNFLIIRERHPDRRFGRRDYLLGIIKVSAGLALMQMVLWMGAWYSVFAVLLFFPIPILLNFLVLEEDAHLWKGMRRTAFLIGPNYSRLLSLFLTLALVGLLFFSILDTFLLSTFLDLISWIIQFEESTMNQLSQWILTYVTMLALYLVSSMLLAGMGVFYYSLREIQEADLLRARVRQIGRRRQIQGLDQEG